MCTKLCFLRQGEDTFHRPQTLIVNLLPLCYIRCTRTKLAGTCWSNRVYEIPNSKHQITNKSQIPIQNDQNRFGILNTPMYIAQHDSYMSPPSQETGSQLVIPAKSGGGGREPGSRKNLIILNIYWIPDLARLGGLVRNDGFGEL